MRVEFHFDRVAHFLPRQVQPLLLMFRDFAFRCTDQIQRPRLGRPHLGQDLFGGNTTIHHPNALGPTIGVFDVLKKLPQRRAIRCVAIHDFISQWKAIRRHDQSDDHLQAVRPAITTVAAFGLGIPLHLAFEVGAGQVVEQDFEIGLKQIRPFLSQIREDLLFVLQNPIQATI